ncbi:MULTISPECIES: chlorophyll synthase ChlG [unclassified Ectothiorhodospira]|uniref:chlorophyll synthase ChlG n=1 Tax=unclassified Ectothiorhodospira TaxID=2684909 RepID=UPI001EE8D91D|nr:MULTISPECIES: chlorophyll synthase ChlG [unclassified Ectothiorhodospira]MCG5515996.1 chlorophyll synthase ChlG [Ectothiorhodospira sp. 9100]MCG5519010.1 chlorophyll synthase ChlG [Ectothiorhodospira sp. 9905]
MSLPQPRAILEVTHPVTWFPPMWAYACGVVSAGVALGERWVLIIVGVMLAGPLICGTSQVVNDWFDRHVDAINEPHRPIPSGRIPGQWGLWLAILWTLASLALATVLGIWGFIAAVFGLILAWAYSAPPTRLKRNGWWGNSAVAICYEGVPWFTGVVVMAGVFPDWRIIAVALLYSIGAHGIMTLNDFKSVEGDRQMGLGSLPVKLGVDRAAKLACWVMAIPQLIVVALLLTWGAPIYAAAVAVLLVVQVGLMVRLLKRPKELAPWYNATGITLYVSGMMVTAFALSSMDLMAS